MRTSKKKPRFTYQKNIRDEPMPLEEWEAAERILAKLVAEAYAADHPEIFGQRQGKRESESEDKGKSYKDAGGEGEGPTD